MARGLPKSYIKKFGVTKKAWREYRKDKKIPRSTPKTKTRKRTMARKKKRRSRGLSLQRTMFKLLRIGSLVAPGIINYTKISGDTKTKIGYTLLSYAGIKSTTKQFDFGLLAQTWTPFLITNLVTYGIPKLNGIIRRL